LLTGFICSGCSGKTKEGTQTTDPSLYCKTDMPRLTKENYVETLLKEVQHYPEEPLYGFFLHHSRCNYEIFLNDVLIDFDFTYEKHQVTPYFLNYYILRSGPQKVTYRLYPVGEVEEGTLLTLVDNTDFKIEITKQNKREEDRITETVLEYRAPRIKKNDWSDRFEGAGEVYYEGSCTFEAEVPYVNEGWSKGQDLRKFDRQKLLNETVKFFQKQHRIYQNKDTDALLSYLFRREKEMRQSEYESKEELEKIVNIYTNPFSFPDYKVQPLENYKLVLYGNGKLVTLEQASVDIMFRKESALWFNYTDGDEEISSFRTYLLYLPEGKPLDADEFIVIQ